VRIFTLWVFVYKGQMGGGVRFFANVNSSEIWATFSKIKRCLNIFKKVLGYISVTLIATTKWSAEFRKLHFPSFESFGESAN
jgi:hypothetical protein